jgi:hypothetical protein
LLRPEDSHRQPGARLSLRSSALGTPPSARTTANCITYLLPHLAFSTSACNPGRYVALPIVANEEYHLCTYVDTSSMSQQYVLLQDPARRRCFPSGQRLMQARRMQYRTISPHLEWWTRRISTLRHARLHPAVSAPDCAAPQRLMLFDSTRQKVGLVIIDQKHLHDQLHVFCCIFLLNLLCYIGSLLYHSQWSSLARFCSCAQSLGLASRRHHSMLRYRSAMRLVVVWRTPTVLSGAVWS